VVASFRVLAAVRAVPRPGELVVGNAHAVELVGCESDDYLVTRYEHVLDVRPSRLTGDEPDVARCEVEADRHRYVD
jgi:hypothetical protein